MQIKHETAVVFFLNDCIHISSSTSSSFSVFYIYYSFCTIILCVKLSLLFRIALWSPRAHLHVVGMLRFMSDINEPSLPTPFYSVLMSISVFMALSTVFHSMNSPDNSLFSHSVLPVLPLP